MQVSDVIVIGGGMIGGALAYGLARNGIDTVVLDGTDTALRAARGNFGLVWVQGKGRGMPRYAAWSRESADLWPEFAAELQEASGVDVGYAKPGGLEVCLDDEELDRQRREIEQMRSQAGAEGYDCELLDRCAVSDLLPGVGLGEAVVGAGYCPHDGHLNPLLLLRALHGGFRRAGGRYFPAHEVLTIGHDGEAFVVGTTDARFSAPRLVLAAGLGAARLAPLVGIDLPIRPERGQILVTERVRQFLPMPLGGMRQTVEGGILLGASNEDVGFDDGTTIAVTKRIAARAVRMIPAIAALRLVRTWGALRILTPDQFPVYEESRGFPGAFAAASHSGVTLAAVNARLAAPWIVENRTPSGFDHFSSRRFDVQATA